MEICDEKLVDLCKSKDMKGFELLYSKYEKYIYSLCYYYTNSKEDSLDLLQEIYIKIYKSINSFDTSKSLLPWLKRITINTCLNYIRDKKNPTASLNVSLNDKTTDYQEIIPDPNTVEKEIDFLSTKQLLKKSIEGLPDEMKSVVILRHVEDMSYQAISDVLSLPVGTVKTYLFRGRRLLKESLKKQGVWEV
ncbi:RNA polymerase sigma-70 factor, ECF subfamily [Natronincola peptidivorans]|uniref:RNA polymerase sigma-70 factor, ECF subfamily n=1 Tax=Natronincola peptidivorans TaxID=426128 RepID=A0A1H9Y5E5_9FIRM|nr:RNA polymerase sigma factor [Natronincola peptidivorans]SES64019.1 RNA polymerase sigma-70 factor, ECF subfamily [Natronincola peptidivorans]